MSNEIRRYNNFYEFWKDSTGDWNLTVKPMLTKIPDGKIFHIESLGKNVSIGPNTFVSYVEPVPGIPGIPGHWTIPGHWADVPGDHNAVIRAIDWGATNVAHDTDRGRIVTHIKNYPPQGLDFETWEWVLWTPTPAPTFTPTSTATPTPTPTVAPKILLAGYWDTDLRAETPGTLILMAFAEDFTELRLLAGNTPTGATLYSDVHGEPTTRLELGPIYPPKPGLFLFELLPLNPWTRGNVWPYLTVE
jgi:hypothetical protein